MSLQPLSNPVTNVGRVVYNARRDGADLRKRRRAQGRAVYTDGPASKGSNTAEMYSVHAHDLLLMNISHKKRRVGKTNDTDIHVMSSANHIRIDDPVTSDKRSEVEILRDQLTFGGIASNAARFDENNNHNEETFATQFGGLATIVNTGDEDIAAGDFVMWDLPDPNSVKANRWKHAPKSKALFVTRPFDFNDSMIDMKTQSITDIEKLFFAFKKQHYDYTRRCIGRAMSGAKSGESFDILLGNYCV